MKIVNYIGTVAKLTEFIDFVKMLKWGNGDSALYDLLSVTEFI